MAKQLLFGTAGIPISCNGNVLDAMQTLNELELNAMELEFVRGVNMKKELAQKLKIVAEKNNIALTVHAPYYINLNTLDKRKFLASKKRIIDSAVMGGIAGAKSVAIHAAYFMKMDEKIVLQKLVSAFNEILQDLKNCKIFLSPETGGKLSQFGSLEQHLELAQEVNGLKFCIDFAHLHARGNGCLKEKKDFDHLLQEIEKVDKNFLKEMHIHCSGINYSPKGEKNHLILKESDFNYKALMESLKEFDVSGILICESPNLEEDSLLMKKYYDSL